MFIHIYLYFTSNHRDRGCPPCDRFPDSDRGVQPLSTRSVMMETPSDRGDFPRSRTIVHGGSVVDGRNRASRSVITSIAVESANGRLLTNLNPTFLNLMKLC
ncbi:hypothetical protein DPMN_163859 [Dreissena polymorpha]|uniref:Uncharacterized protein n=1 Tax=Dreissena polymorpha TaxID=45954 RepID=A0A9D4IT72_DREPO|nr:hypothetical protein DPMN_163859 [Dreissena polymorpha]